MDWDSKIFLFLNGFPHHPAIDWLMFLISSSISVLVFIFFLILLYRAFMGVKDFREVVFLLLTFVLGFLLITQATKNLVARARPFETLPQAVVVGENPADYSFPSAHSFAIAFLAVLAARKKDKLLFFFLPFSFLVGFSRIYLGVHYPSDVFVGLGLGFLYGLTVNLLIDRFIEHRIFKILKFHVE